jgi:predicted ester cyclase
MVEEEGLATNEDIGALIRRYYHDVWEAGNAEAQQQLLARDNLDHDPTPGLPPTREGVTQLAAAVAVWMRDVRTDAEDAIVEDSRADAHRRMRRTRRGSFLGVLADGEQIRLYGHDFYRVRNGRIAEIWRCEDFLSVTRRLGAVPMLG